MNRYRYLALPAYLAAAALILIPFTDAALSLYPWRPGVAQWRFGAVGLMSNAFMIPTAGLLIMLTTALVLGHWRTLRVLGLVCGVAALFTGMSIGLFGLDAKLRLGQRGQSIAFAQGSPSAIAHAALTMEKFEPQRTLAVLRESGAGDLDAAREAVTFSDPDGIRIQLR